MEKIHHLINADFTERLRNLDELAKEIGKFLSIDTENRIWPMIKNGRLILLTDDPHLATHIRFQQNTLNKHLSKHLNIKLGALHIKLISLPFASFVEKSNGFTVSDGTANIMVNIARGITDPDLQASMISLALTASNARRIQMPMDA